jgi:uncharacterized membrane protein YdjX (TVP38/TMEM64 family)
MSRSTMNLYVFTLLCHSYTRWAVLLAVAWMVGLSATGWRQKRPWTQLDERSHRLTVGLADLQFTLGVILYLFLSPFSDSFFSNPGLGIREPSLRFFGLEHILGMFIGVGLVHLGRTLSLKAAGAGQRQGRTCVCTLCALVVMLGSIPWPFLRYGRPLLRVLVF